MPMIKIGEAAVLLGLTDDEKGKARAREVLNFFNVKRENIYDDGNQRGRFHCEYDIEEVQKIASFRRGFPNLI